MKQKKKICKRCGKERYLFSNGRCLQCTNIEKTNNTKIKPVESRYPINKVSTRQAKINAAYSVLRRKFLLDHPVCQAQLNECTRVATQVHHKAGRLGANMLDSTKWLAVCYSCHEWIETHPKEAKELGLSQSRIGK